MRGYTEKSLLTLWLLVPGAELRQTLEAPTRRNYCYIVGRSVVFDSGEFTDDRIISVV